MINSKRKKVARSKLWRLQQGKCCYCREPMTRTGEGARRATLEHLRRLCDGGTSRLDNLALACRDCNAGRGSVDWLTYASLKQGEMYNEA